MADEVKGRIKRPDFKTSDQLFDQHIGPEGSPERIEFERKAQTWYYGEILRDRRQELKLTQQALAERTGTARSYIARVEQGKTDIQFSSLLRIASALGLKINIQ